MVAFVTTYHKLHAAVEGSALFVIFQLLGEHIDALQEMKCSENGVTADVRNSDIWLSPMHQPAKLLSGQAMTFKTGGRITKRKRSQT